MIVGFILELVPRVEVPRTVRNSDEDVTSEDNSQATSLSISINGEL